MQFDFNWENKLYTIKSSIILAVLTGKYCAWKPLFLKLNLTFTWSDPDNCSFQIIFIPYNILP